MGYGVSTGLLGGADLQSALRRIAAAQFEQVEVLAEPPHLSPGLHDTSQVKSWLDDFGLQARVGHGIFSDGRPNCGVLDESKRRESVKHIAACFEPLVAIGAEFVVLHPTGYSLNDFTDQRRPQVVSQVVKSMTEMAKIAEETGIKLAWENLPHRNTARPLHDMRELRSLIDPMPDHVGLCLDTTHALISGHDPLAQLDIASDRLFCLHLHDSNGQDDCHWVPGRGIIDWKPFIKRLGERGFSGTRTIEVLAGDGDDEDEVMAQTAAISREWDKLE